MITGAVFCWQVASSARGAPARRGQPAATIRRVGWLSIGSETSTAHLHVAFTQGMRDLGWLEGKDVELRFVYADGDVNRLDALASELVGQKVEVIVLGAAAAARAAQRATQTIPIVMAGVANALARVVASPGQAGGNITAHQPANIVFSGQADRDPP